MAIWTFNVLGMRPAVWVGYVTGGLLLIPLAVIMFLPYITGDWHSSNMNSTIHWTSLTGDNGIKLVIVWLYVMCWSSYGIEIVARLPFDPALARAADAGTVYLEGAGRASPTGRAFAALAERIATLHDRALEADTW